MKVVLSLFILITSSGLLAQTPRRYCSQPTATPGEKTLEQFSAELTANNISVVPGNTVQPKNVEGFLLEYRKFPEPLRSEMVQRGARIVLMEGTGVTADPTFTDSHTHDGRDWSQVPGSGGEVSQHFNIPTRIVANSLYEKHGSSNLILHEHAHTLDSLYGRHGVSTSGTWQNLMSAAPGHMEFAKLLCDSYCTEHPEEAFAELFAYYYSCEETRKHMEEDVPQLADFFKNLTSIDNLLKTSPAARSIAAVAATPISADAKEECVPHTVKDITEKIKPLTNITPFLQNITAPSYKARSGISVSAPGMK